MQAVLEQPGAATRSFWKGGKDSDYMMRAERRPGGYGSSSQKKRKKKPKKHILYAIITVLLLIVLWPVGLIMLWLPKLRWKGYVKFILSIVTLFVFMSLLSLALYAPTDNVKVQEIQQKGLEVMDTVEKYGTMAMDGLLDGSERAVESIKEAVDPALNLGAQLALEGAEWVNDKAELAWYGIDLAQHKINGTTPEPTVEPTPVPTPEPTPTVEPTPTPTPKPLAVVQPVVDAMVYTTNNGSYYHMAESCVGMNGALPTTLGNAVMDGYLPCSNCAVPQPEVLSSEEMLLWADEAGMYHTVSNCSEFNGLYAFKTLEECYNEMLSPCEVCEATDYIYKAEEDLLMTPEPLKTAEPVVTPSAEPSQTPEATKAVTGTPNPDQTPVPQMPTVEATAEPTAEPTPTATPAPTPVPTPAATLKPASQATVYHTTNGGWYHMAETCKNMSNAKPFTLQSSVDGGLLNCRTCAAPGKELLEAEYVVWVDEQGCFHTGDECEFFQGKYTLMTLDDAVLAGMTACMDCGANQYVPFTTVTVAPTAEPGTELTEEELMELAKDVTVYYSTGSRYYHTSGQCQTMKHGSPYSMYEALTTNHEWCAVCQPPKLEDLPLEP